MLTPFVLLLLCLAGVGGAISMDGAELTLSLAVSGLASAAAGILLIKAICAPTAAPKRARPKRKRGVKGPQVVIDGSNVMHWNGQEPDIATLKEVIAELRAQGCEIGVIFDANAGYKLQNRYLDDRRFAKLLKLPKDRVLVVNSGEPADPTILSAARDLGAKVVTNDRFRTWVSDFPEVASNTLLVRGGYRFGKLWLEEQALFKGERMAA